MRSATSIFMVKIQFNPSFARLATHLPPYPLEIPFQSAITLLFIIPVFETSNGLKSTILSAIKARFSRFLFARSLSFRIKANVLTILSKIS